MPMSRSPTASNRSNLPRDPDPHSMRQAPARRDSSISTDSEYAKKCKELMQLNLDLRALGANSYFDLPRIVVSGGQSAGKSSLVEAVTGINVPRDSGTCTRCLMECTMLSGFESWSCAITLHLDHDESGNELEQPKEESFGPRITDKNEVELWLRRAQAAILSPHRFPAEFLDKTKAGLQAMYGQPTGGSSDMVPFSFNSVHLHVQDPNATDLSFVDLPGLIQNHADKKMIELVKNLVERSMGGENTIIVVTIPLADDIENQQAFLLAREEDPHGERTIGVGTKPDTLSPGSTGLIQKWKDIFEGRMKELKHGYYCVKLPDDAERAEGISRIESETRATQFFSTTEPWNTLADRSRLGIPNFISSISKLLVRLIETNLPHLREHVEEQLRICRDELEEMPNAIASEDALIEIFSRVSRFTKAFNDTILGYRGKDFVQRNRRTYQLFKQEIQKTFPKFEVYGHVGDVTSSMDTISHKEVREIIDKCLTWELPHYVPFDATKELVLRHIEHWNTPAISCFADVCTSVSYQIDKLIKMPENFGPFEDLQHFLRRLIREEEENCKHHASEALNKVLELENGPLFTQLTETFENEKSKWIQLHSHPSQHQIQDEMKVITDVEAYFQVAARRIIDYVPLTIEHHLIQLLGSRLEKKLTKSLYDIGNDDSDRLEEFLKEDASVAGRRKVLNGRASQLIQIKRKLDEYEESSSFH